MDESSDSKTEDLLINIDEDERSDEKKEENTYKVVFFITLPVFMGYACCFSLQKKLSFVFGLTEGVSGTRLSVIYGIGVSFVFFFNLIFRVFGHNIIFGCFHPRDRVIISLLSLMVGMIMLSVLSLKKTTQNVMWVFISYAFIGACDGSFGPNMLTVVNDLGDTRLYVILAMPTGVACITIVSFCLMAFGIPFQAFYIITTLLSLFSLFTYLFTIYPASKVSEGVHHSSKFNLKEFLNDIKEIKHWFPKIALHSLCFLFNTMCMALFNPGCTLYAYKNRVTFRLINFTISHEWFMFLYNTGGFLGDFISRKVMNKKRLINPFLFLCLIFFGLAINLSLIPEIAPIASFLFMWANGGIYCQTTKMIGDLFKDKYHLTATSTWLFIGDAGSTTGSNFVQLILPLIEEMKTVMF